MNANVEALADAVESLIERHGITLTMGGEPTFIPTQPEGPEWHQEAMGPEKLGYARRMAARFLRERHPGGLVMQVFGKQYPGEPLPRWVVRTIARVDGHPVWRRPEVFALDEPGGDATADEARDLMMAIAKVLGVDAYVLPCVEEDESEPASLGWVLPIDHRDGDWVSGGWPYSKESPVLLVPGSSPFGLRLPLGVLEEAHLHRALTVERTERGEVHVFMPPLEADAFFELLEAIERAAEDLKPSTLVLCGYSPTSAAGLTSIGLAADPGVLELNLPPTRTWREYDTVLTEVTEVARAEGLTTTRYHLNGQIQGTGGGAHVLFGGPSVDENPFFDDPRLLASIVRYWQRHPALSYFFSGQYVGPGSQAPRGDETLMAKLYELETACFGVDAVDGTEDRGFLDRVFRNLLTDSAGNMHLAEISIDKLWNYDSPTGLQGLIELRAFETMPDVRLQSLAALFVRAIVAMLADQPAGGPLVRHGPALHDRFMLPAGLWQDLGMICDDLAAAGLPFEHAWLRDIFELRFPVLGRLEVEGGAVAVRQALEPWPLMAEMTLGGTTSRVVDNSTDRLEVSFEEPALAERFDVAVDGVALDFHQLGEAVAAGVRYKAASGWPALHPHVPLQSPLRFDVLDSKSVVVASASYYFWNPDGPRYEGPPRDRGEALARQAARWRPLDVEVGTTVRVAAGKYTEESQDTLDLRRQ